MDQTPPLSINLTQEELYLVLAQFGTQSIPGLENHWQKELTPTNLAMALDIAMRSLIARGLCQPTLEHNRIRLKPAVIALVGVCAKPEVTLALLCQQGQGPATPFFFHRAQKLWVGHTIPFTAIHSFVAFQSQPEFWQGFLAAANLPNAVENNQTAAQLTVSGFEKALNSGNPQAAQEALVAAGLEASLARDLAKPDLRLSVARQDQVQKTTASLTFLGKEQRLWLLTEVVEGTLLVQAISGKSAQEKLQELATV